jgi:hypothetical protein
LAINALVTVAGVALPEPSSYSGNTSTLVDSARNVEGYMIGSVIRDDVAKIELQWRYLTVQQWASINKLFKRSAGGAFINSVTFFDQSAGTYITRQMYVSDRHAGMWRRDPSTGSVMGWTDCQLSLVEV